MRRRRPYAAAGAALQAVLVLVWLIGWPIRWMIYSPGPAADALFYTNWNWFMSGLFFLIAWPSLLCLPACDSVLHLLFFTTLVFSNAVTFVGGMLVVAENATLLTGSTAAWSTVFLGERVVHVLGPLFVLLYALLRLNDLKWIWQGHAHAARVACGPCTGTCTVASVLLLQLALPWIPLLCYRAFLSVLGADYYAVYTASTLSLAGALLTGVTCMITFQCVVMCCRPRGTLRSGE